MKAEDCVRCCCSIDGVACVTADVCAVCWSVTKARVAELEGELLRLEAYRRGLKQHKLIAGLPLPRELEDALDALAKLVPVNLAPNQLDSYDWIAKRAVARIYSLASENAALSERVKKLEYLDELPRW